MQMAFQVLGRGVDPDILRERRLRWVGHVLRMDENRLIRKVLLRSFASERRTQAGSIWMDVPQSVDTEEELLRLVGEHGEHAEWNDLVRIVGGRDPAGYNATLQAITVTGH